MPKKRAPLKDLRYLKQFADERLIEKKLMLPHEQSALQRIFSSKDAPILPGLPAYLPHRHTILTTRRVLFDLAVEWNNLTSTNRKKQEDVSEFFRHVIRGMEQENSKVKKLMLESVIKQEYDMGLFQRKSVVSGIAKFLVDSFAVSIIEKTNSSVSEYMEWFLRWTDSLLKQWERKQDGRQPNFAQPSSQTFIQTTTSTQTTV